MNTLIKFLTTLDVSHTSGCFGHKVVLKKVREGLPFWEHTYLFSVTKSLVRIHLLKIMNIPFL